VNAPLEPNYSGPKGPEVVDASGRPLVTIDGTRNSTTGNVPKPDFDEGTPIPKVTVRPALTTSENVNAWKAQVQEADETENRSLDTRMSAAQYRGTIAVEAQNKLEAAKNEHDARVADLQQRMNDELTVAEKRLEGSRVDPTRYINNMSTGKKIMSILAVLLGSLGAALTRSDRNLALDVLNQQIDRDIEVQKGELQKNKERLAQIEAKYGSLMNWEMQRYAEATAHVSRILAMGAARADSADQQAMVLHDQAVLKDGAVRRGSQRAIEGWQADTLTKPVTAGGGRTPPRLKNRAELEAFVISRTTSDASEVPKRAGEVSRMSDAELANAANALGGMAPASATGGSQQSADARRDAELLAEENYWADVERKELANHNPEGATLASRRRALVHLVRVQRAEPNKDAVEQFSTNYMSRVGSTVRELSHAVGISDDPSVHLNAYSNEVLRGNK